MLFSVGGEGDTYRHGLDETKSKARGRSKWGGEREGKREREIVITKLNLFPSILSLLLRLQGYSAMPPLLEKTTAIESESAIPGSFPSHSSGSSQESLISSPILLSSDSSPYKQPLKRRRRVSNESLSLETVS